jgi:DedD protein
MEQELKQNLIGAAIITALAAIFIPMLFDEPVNDSGKSINSLALPEIPAKVQDVEITPLPEKVQDVATQAPKEKANIPTTPANQEFVEEDVETPKPKLHLSSKETEPALRHPKVAEHVVQIDEDVPEAEEAPPINRPVKSVPQPVTEISAQPGKQTKIAAKPAETVAPKAIDATGPANETGTRLYLNVGSFTQKANAISLLDSLKQQGFPAVIKEVTSDKGPTFKVRVGPLLDKAKAQAIKNKLTQININSFVSPDD